MVEVGFFQLGSLEWSLEDSASSCLRIGQTFVSIGYSDPTIVISPGIRRPSDPRALNGEKTSEQANADSSNRTGSGF